MKRGDDITKDNHDELIAILETQSRQSFGMVKNEDIVDFLKGWFK